MKLRRIFSLVMICTAVLSSRLLTAQEIGKTMQLLVPMEIYVGDTAELRITFNSPIVISASGNENNSAGSKVPAKDEVINLDVKDSSFSSVDTICSVVSAKLIRNGLKYTIALTVIPWKPGSILLPAFDVEKMLPGYRQTTEDPESESGSSMERPKLLITPQPFNVVSLSEKRGITRIQPALPPLLVPGTTYIVYFILVILIAFLILVFYMLANMKKVLVVWQRFISAVVLSRNDRSALRHLKKLKRCRESVSEKNYCAELQRIIRFYLQGRFNDDYTTLSTSDIELKMKETVGDDLSERLLRVLHRTDYIRYAAGSFDSQKSPKSLYAAELKEGESTELADTVKDVILEFSNGSDEKEEKNAEI